MKEHIVSPALLREKLVYDPETGLLHWKRRHGARAFKNKNKKGYLVGYVFGYGMQSHRVAWAMYHDEWPKGEIDHINGDKADNRIVNLRVVTTRENSKNRPIRKDNSSGYVGVYWVRDEQIWMAQIKVDGKQKTIGRYKTLEAAVTARKEAERKYGYHENHGRKLIA